MFDFLGTLGNFAGMAGDAAGPIQSILSAIMGPKKPEIPESERYAKSLLMALGEPNNSYVNAMTDAEFQKLKAGQGGDIMSKVLADRREAAMGRAPVFFDPERRDENISQQLSRGTPMLQQQASQNAIQKILEAAGVRDFAKPEALRNQAFEEAKLKSGGTAGSFGSIGSSLQKILQSFNGGNYSGGGNAFFPSSQSNAYGPFDRSDYTSNGDKIRWNQMVY